MYGFWVKPDRFVNFQGLYATYLNQLKILAYRFEDLFTGKTERFHEPGIDGYIIEAGSADAVKSYFKTYALPEVKYAYSIAASGTIATDLVPGSVLIATEGIYNLIADNGQGSLVKVDGFVVGTIDYATGAYKLDISVSDFGSVIVGYAVVGTNVTYQTFDGAITGSSAIVKEIKGGLIPGSQAGLSVQIIVIEDGRKFFVGFTTNDQGCQSKIISKLLGTPVTVGTPADLTTTPDSLTIAKGSTGTATIAGGIAPYSAVSDTTDATVAISGTTITVSVDENATAGSATITVSDNASTPDTATITVTIS